MISVWSKSEAEAETEAEAVKRKLMETEVEAEAVNIIASNFGNGMLLNSMSLNQF